MLLHIPRVIDSIQLGVIQGALKQSKFVDGKLSAGMVAEKVKRNEEVDQHTDTAVQLSKIIIGNLYHHAVFRSAAMPLRVATPFFARYRPGMTYGDHIDDPVMGGDGQRFRCDIATTVFLNEPEEYVGGELLIRTQFGDQKIKLPAGDAVVYPASSLHQVAEVTEGERVVAVTWVQSMIREPAKREILHELNLAREKLLHESAAGETGKQVDHAYTNLVRMWAEV
jgi:PKHD-type hydroxylase